VAPNKFLAKIASELKKPDGLTIVEQEGVASLLSSLPLAKIPGVGKKTLEKIKKLGLENASDILRVPEKLVVSIFGNHGQRLLSLARGVDESMVTPHRSAKSISVERTFTQDTMDREILRKWLLLQAEEVGRRLRHSRIKAKTVNLKLKDCDFKIHTRRRTMSHSTNLTSHIYKEAVILLNSVGISKPLRLIGIEVSTLEAPGLQLDLWEKTERDFSRRGDVDQAIDDLKARYGRKIIQRGSLMDFEG
jgi:DNA polymerase-4